jgi:multiple sugar transport system permease protein
MNTMSNAGEKTRKKANLLKNEERWGYFFIGPQFLGLLLFVLIPIIQSLGISFTRWNLLSDPVFIGIANYKKILRDPLTLTVLKNTLRYIFGFCILTTITSLLLALVLSSKIKGRAIFRTLFYLPNITSSVAIALLWMYMFNPDFGLINFLLYKVGVSALGWYASLKLAMPTVIMMSSWMACGYYMVIFLAGIGSISDSDVLSKDRKSSQMDQKPVIDTYKMLQALITEGVSPSPLAVKAMPYEQMFLRPAMNNPEEETLLRVWVVS